MSKSLIEQMKVEAQMVTEMRESALLRNERHAKAVQSVIGPLLGQIHQYLSEFKQYASVLKDSVTVDFKIHDATVCNGLVQTGYRLNSGDDPLNTVVFSANLSSNEPIKVGLEYRGKVKPLLDRLRKSGLIINKHSVSNPDTDNQVLLMDIEPTIPMVMEFKSNNDLKTIDIVVKNYDELGVRKHTIRADQLNESSLDELGKFILRKPNDFLTEDVSWGYRKRLKQKLDHDSEEKHKSLSETAEMVVGKLRSMLNKKPARIILSIRDNDIDVKVKDLPYELGRKGTDGQLIESQHISRKHATIVKEHGKIYLCDHSNNGTYIKAGDDEMIKIQDDQFELTGRGLMALGEPINDVNQGVIYYSCET